MLVVPDFLVYLFEALVVIAATYLLYRAIRNRKRRMLAAPQAFFAVALSVFVYLVARHTYDVVVVEDGDKGLQAERMKTIGEPDHPETWIYAKDPTWILNRSSKPIYLELVQATRVVVEPSLIKPGEVLVDQRVDHIGPAAPRTPAAGESVLWLRWNTEP